MTYVGRILRAMRGSHISYLLVCIHAGIGLGFSQSDAAKDVDGWSKANWGMTTAQVMQAFTDAGAIPSTGLGLQCDSAVEIPAFQFDTQERKSALAKAKFRVTFSADQWSRRLCGITIRPTRSVRFDDVKAMLVKLYGEPMSVETDKLMPRATWFFPSTTISLVGDWSNVHYLYFRPKKTEKLQRLFNPPVLQSNAVPAAPAQPPNASPQSPTQELTSNESSPPSTTLSGKAFLLTRGGDLKVARFSQVFVLVGEATNQFSKNAQFRNYERSIDNLRSIAPSSENIQESIRLECISSLMRHFEMTLDLKKAYPTSVMTSESDEEGAFKVKGLRPGTYAVLVFGRGGANAALWMEQVTLENGNDDPLKMRTTKISCFDPQGLAKF